MKAILEEQEVQSSEPVAQQRSAQTVVVRAVPRLPKPKPQTIDTPSNVDGYESCLDLAAQFLARG